MWTRLLDHAFPPYGGSATTLAFLDIRKSFVVRGKEKPGEGKRNQIGVGKDKQGEGNKIIIK